MAAQTGTTTTGTTTTGTTTTGTTTTGTTTTGTTTTGTTTTGRTARRADAGVIQLTGRDIDGLLLCGEHYGAPYDLLAAALQVPQGRLPAIVRRWRRAGYAATGRLGPGPGWCWLTRDGMTATGLGFPALRPALGRLAHIRAVLAARLWLETGPAWSSGHAWWHSERRLRARPARGRPRRARPGRGDPLAQHSRQPLRRAGLGGRSRAHPQAHRPDHPHHG